GTDDSALRFIEALLLLCLLSDSPPTDAAEQAEIGRNQLAVARRGRDPQLRLERDGKSILLRDWGRQLLSALEPICAMLDQDQADKPYGRTLAARQAAMEDADLTPSARMLRDMGANGESFFRFAKRLSEAHRECFLAHPLPAAAESYLAAQAKASLLEQAAIEAADRLSFEEYLHRYFAQS
ncbi:MAG TPA: glutamate--cysteine ligase, partial [Gammaproteobacteria bacterium]|nr:glutamate--cysteine ligase [Gammaproteobacteria bacterium]